MNYREVIEFSPRLLEIANKYHILRLWIIGSVARGTEPPGSDVDFLLEMEEGFSLFNIAGFGYEAELLLGVRVDVVPVSVLSKLADKSFFENAQKDAIPI